MKRRLALFVSSAMAGGCVAVGGTLYLSIESKVVGALFFSIGLFAVLTRGYHLYTGRICYAVGQPVSYIGDLALIWLGNFAGVVAVVLPLLATRFGIALHDKAAALVQTKLEDSLFSLFLLGIFCGMLMCLAVDSYKTIADPVGKYLPIFICVAGFILSGFEHCVASMYYFALSGAWSGRMLVCLLAMTAGNTVGGLLLPNVDAWLKKVKP